MGANAVVTKDIPYLQLWGPAKIIGYKNREKEAWASGIRRVADV